MKNLILVLTLIFPISLLVKCSNTPYNDKPNFILNNETDVDDAGVYFLKTAALKGMMELELGKLALQKGQSQKVKDFGSMMINYHSKMNKELYQLGIRKGLLMPETLDPDLQEHINNVKQVSDLKFDHIYVKMMVENHQKDIQNFELGSRNRKKDVKKFASEKLTLLKMHLDSAVAIYNLLKVSAR